MRLASTRALFRAFSSSRALTPGALCTDATFTRVLGSPGESEPILLDLLSAWRQAQTGDASAAVAAVVIGNRKVIEGHGLHAKGALTADVRAVGDDESYLVEVQHRAEATFPHRALIYSAAEVVAHHMSNPAGLTARRVHTLAFCDYDFQELSNRAKKKATASTGFLSSKSSRWRTDAYQRDEALALQIFGLHASPRAMVGRKVNTALERELSAHASFVFALLPHAPRLEDLSTATPPLLRWAALVAHVEPSNLSAVPKEVRVEGVARLLDVLSSTAVATRTEREEAEYLAASDAQALADALAEGEAKGEAEGEAKGMAGALRLMGVATVNEYRTRFGTDPPPQLASFLAP